MTMVHVNDERGPVSRRTRGPLAVDLGYWPSLVRFAAVSLVDQTRLSKTEIAASMGKSPSSFSMSLFGRRAGESGPPTPISHAFCLDLQRYLQTAPGTVGDTA